MNDNVFNVRRVEVQYITHVICSSCIVECRIEITQENT